MKLRDFQSKSKKTTRPNKIVINNDPFINNKDININQLIFSIFINWINIL